MSTREEIVLITGANSGIGYDSAKAFAAASSSYHIIMTCRSAEKAAQALSDVKKLYPNASLSTIQLDITDSGSVDRAAKMVDEQFGHLDILINNAGILPKSKTLAEQMREAFETNTVGQAVMTEAFRPLLTKSTNARLIFVSTSLSSVTLRLRPEWTSYNVPATPYRMSKAALNMYAACVAKDGKEQGIRVWVIDPGLVATNLAGDKEALKRRGAGSSEVSAQTILSVVEGKRDADVEKLLHKDGVYPW